jgi:hypothetical protein
VKDFPGTPPAITSRPLRSYILQQVKKDFKIRVDYIVSEPARCQLAKKIGYVGATPNEYILFAQVARGQIRSSGFYLNGGWSPWYTVHKPMAGLEDAYLYAGNKQALEIVTGMADWKFQKTEYEAEKKRQKEIDARTIDYFRIGEMQPERDHHLAATERSYVCDAIGRMGREARTGHHFSFSMQVEPEEPNILLLSYIGDNKDRFFDILADGELFTTVEWKGGQTGRFCDQLYAIPVKFTNGKKKLS